MRFEIKENLLEASGWIFRKQTHHLTIHEKSSKHPFTLISIHEIRNKITYLL